MPRPDISYSTTHSDPFGTHHRTDSPEVGFDSGSHGSCPVRPPTLVRSYPSPPPVCQSGARGRRVPQGRPEPEVRMGPLFPCFSLRVSAMEVEVASDRSVGDEGSVRRSGTPKTSRQTRRLTSTGPVHEWKYGRPGNSGPPGYRGPLGTPLRLSSQWVPPTLPSRCPYAERPSDWPKGRVGRPYPGVRPVNWWN